MLHELITAAVGIQDQVVRAAQLTGRSPEFLAYAYTLGEANTKFFEALEPADEADLHLQSVFLEWQRQGTDQLRQEFIGKNGDARSGEAFIAPTPTQRIVAELQCMAADRD